MASYMAHVLPGGTVTHLIKKSNFHVALSMQSSLKKEPRVCVSNLTHLYMQVVFISQYIK